MDERDKIEKIMQTENMNSAQFAMEIGIQGSTLSHILNGRNKPSLDVLKKILNRFRTVNPEWLILNIGTMYRQEKQSQAPTLFDTELPTDEKSEDYTQKILPKNDIAKDTFQHKTVNSIEPEPYRLPEVQQPIQIQAEVQSKSVKKIIVYYSDNTFQEFEEK